MPDKTRTTIQGQAWDQLALELYGAENAMSRLLAANPQARGVLQFSGEKRLSAPDVSDDTRRIAQESLPPWKRELEEGGS